MTPSLVVRNVRPWAASRDAESLDLVAVDGRIAALEADAEAPHDALEVDGANGVLLPSFTDAHTHLDSTLLGLAFRPHTSADGILALIENDRRHWRTAGASVTDRATHTLGRMVEYGVTRVRSHAQIDTDCKLERLEGVLAARAAHGERADVEIVAFPQSGILRDHGTTELLDAALSGGADLVGGIDPDGLDGDPAGHLDIVFRLAERHQCGVDFHLHDRHELGAEQIELIAERVRALDMGGSATISHCFALAEVDDRRRGSLIDLLASTDIAIVTVAPGGVAPLPMQALRDAGVRLGLGQDGIRGYWSPYGNGDVLERAFLLAYGHGFRRDEQLEACVDVATTGGAAVMGVADHSIRIGAGADFVVVSGDTVGAVLVDRPSRSVVAKAGRIVARDGMLV